MTRVVARSRRPRVSVVTGRVVRITIAVGRLEGFGTIRLAPQALLSIAPLALEGTP